MKKTTINEILMKKLEKEERSILFQDEQVVIGSLIKKERIERNLTQKEASLDMCSHSYLSKIEANKIKPNMDCIYKLLSKLDIDKDLIYVIENNAELLKDSYTFYYYRNKEDYVDLFDKVKDINDNQFANTIKLGYYLLNDDLINAEKLIEPSLDIVSSLTKTNLFIYSLYVADFLFRTGKYQEAKGIIEELIYKDCDFRLTIIAKEIYFNICVELNIIVIGATLFNELLDLYSRLSFFDRIEELKIGYLYLLFISKEYKYLLSISKDYNITKNCKNIDKYNYIMAISNFKVEHYNTSREYLNKIDKKSIYYQICIFEREKLNLTTQDMFIKSIENENKTDPSFFYQYYLQIRNNSLDRSLFRSPLRNSVFNKHGLYIKIMILELEIKYEEDNFKYKQANALRKKMEELTSIK